MKLLQGGDGSGNFGHAGRPGSVGGSTKNYSNLTKEEFYDGWDRFWKQISQAEKDRQAVYHWEMNSRDIQYYLRKEKILRSAMTPDEIKEDTERLDKLTSSCYLEKNSIVYRGMPNPPNFKAGDTFIDKGYTATSWNIAEAQRFRNLQEHARIFRIFLPEGTPVGYGNEAEGEILLGRNKKFKVSRVSDEFIDLEVVE